MALTIDEFVSVARESRLVNPDLLDSMLCEGGTMGSFHDTHALASRLVGRGALTHWQSEKLLSGVSSGFFLGKYKLQRLIASGSMSSVYEAEHTLLHKRFALKVLPKALVEEASFLERFYREARAVVRLDHPNIIRGFDVGQEGDYHYFVMEYLEGSSFQDLIETGGPIAADLAANLIKQAAQGLDHAHQAGMIHRDIKPANLLLAADGVVKVLDLGLVRSLPQEIDGEAGLTRIHDERMLGTVDYLSPEQAIDSHNVDIRSDIYSLGCTFYFLLTGDPPFAKGTLTERLLAHQTRSAVPISVIRPDVPTSLGRIMSKMLEKRLDARYQTPAEVVKAIEEWSQAQVVQQVSAPAPSPNPSPQAVPWLARPEREADSECEYEGFATMASRLTNGTDSRVLFSSTARNSAIVRSGGAKGSSTIVKGRESKLGRRSRLERDPDQNDGGSGSGQHASVVPPIRQELWLPWSQWAKAVNSLASNSSIRFMPSAQSYLEIFEDLMIACREVSRGADPGTKRIIREIQDITAPWMNLETLRSILQSEMKGSIVVRVQELDQAIMSNREAEDRPKPAGVTPGKVVLTVVAATILAAAYLVFGPEPSPAENPDSWISRTRVILKQQYQSISEKLASH